VKHWAGLTGAIAALATTAVLVVPLGASAGPTPKTPSITTSLRVSHGCTFTVVGKWSNYPAGMYSIQNVIQVDGLMVSLTDTTSESSHGSLKSVYGGTVSTTPTHTVAAYSVIHLPEGGYNSTDTVTLDNINCVG